mmetsp:Transcript_7183/g.19670  ORF Transcript_7183/g.19670 Transcript_7183/m.19670 type:complete len:400 (-) Transcript_7183:268-1467(-)
MAMAQLTEDEIKSLVFEAQIGEGSYGKVHRARLPSTGAIFAVKVADICPEDIAAVKTVEREIAVLRACMSVPQFVQIYGVGMAQDSLKVVMELCDYGSVSEILRKIECFEELEIRIIAHEVLIGLKYLHDDKKIHRDIKGGNILLTRDFQPKLADFGISCQLSNTLSVRNTGIGSPFWMAPEVIKGHPYNAKADLWSLGITCIEMGDGRPPYFHINPMRAMLVIPSKPPCGFKDPKRFSKQLVEFVEACLTVDTQARPSSEYLLQMPFLQSVEASPTEALRASLAPRLGRASDCFPLSQMSGSIVKRPSQILNPPEARVKNVKEEMLRRAKEWVDRTVPMQTVDKAKDGFNVWDSDEEGVSTRTRIEDKAGAGAGGSPAAEVPFYMQVLQERRKEAAAA